MNRLSGRLFHADGLLLRLNAPKYLSGLRFGKRRI
jgi:hypothetical protein